MACNRLRRCAVRHSPLLSEGIIVRQLYVEDPLDLALSPGFAQHPVVCADVDSIALPQSAAHHIRLRRKVTTADKNEPSRPWTDAIEPESLMCPRLARLVNVLLEPFTPVFYLLQ